MPTSKPSAEPHTVAALEEELRALKAHTARVERELEATARELERVRQSRSWRATEPLRTAKARLGGRS